MLTEYIESLRGRHVTVLGIAVSNTPLIRMMAKGGVRVTARDKKTAYEFAGLFEELRGLGVELVCGDDYLENLPGGLIFCTPGINPCRAEVADAVRRGAEVTSEMAVFMRMCPCRVIGITGSDGKTTTTTIINEMLKAAGVKTWLGGNIGTPLLYSVDEMDSSDTVVLEMSSFQLMTVDTSPHIAVLTNVAPNHLDVHTDMAEYVEAKAGIFSHQDGHGVLVTNMDNSCALSLSEAAKGAVRLFSRRGVPRDGAYLSNGEIYINGRAVMNTADITLPGAHNVENYMAACLALDGIVSCDIMARVARDFKGVEHRMELVRTLGGVRYYNDSIATTPSRTIPAVNCFEPMKSIVIAGGSDKNLPFDILGQAAVERVKAMLIIGVTGDKIEAAVRAADGYREGKPEIFRCAGLEEAVQKAYELAEPGDAVLLSPACASFDSFPNYKVRGQVFRELVGKLPQKCEQ